MEAQQSERAGLRSRNPFSHRDGYWKARDAAGTAGLSRSAIALRSDRPPTDGTVGNALSRLLSDGTLTRHEDKTYTVASQACKSNATCKPSGLTRSLQLAKPQGLRCNARPAHTAGPRRIVSIAARE